VRALLPAPLGGRVRSCAAVVCRAVQPMSCLCLQVLPQTQTGHHKFKVASLMLSRNVDYGSYGDFTEVAVSAALDSQQPAAHR